MNARDEFLAERRLGLGGSDLGVIMGVSRYGSPMEIWKEKTGRGVPVESNLQMRFGTYAEEFVAQEYSAATGRRVQRFNTMLRHPTAPIIGHVDRLVIPDGAKRASHQREVRTDTGLECKTANAFALNSEDWGDSGTDEIPESYLIQCVAYQALTGCEHWDLAALFGNQEVRIYNLRRRHDIESMVLEIAAEWWEKYVVHDVPPEPTNEAEARVFWLHHNPGKTIEASPDIAEDVAALADVKTEIRSLEACEQRLRDRIVCAIGDAETLMADGRKLATWKANKPGSRIDFERAYLDLSPPDDHIKNFTFSTNGARVLRLAKTKE